MAKIKTEIERDKNELPASNLFHGLWKHVDYPNVSLFMTRWANASNIATMCCPDCASEMKPISGGGIDFEPEEDSFVVY